MPTILSFDAAALRRIDPSRAATPSSPPEPLARRILNILIAAVGIVLTLPLMACIALAIKCTSPGPVLYLQTRVGLDRRRGVRHPAVGSAEDQGGQPFRMYKFRTMKVAPTTASTAQVWARPDDDRITAIGRWLRKLRLDELPQLFNVLLGDMNVVGPRPEQPAIFAKLRREIHAYVVRQRTRPGITGLAQINLHYDQQLEDVRRKVALDLAYLRRQSVWEDLRIMLLTFPVMIGRRGGW
jgi:lipopolysaccharide/colanic/teichoic acid biosynthesis glycosyltransferase